VHRQRAASQEPRQRKLSVETQPPTSVEAWFLFNSSGELRVGDPDSSDTPPNHPAFWMHISQEYFLVTELSNNLLLNRFEMICPALSLCLRGSADQCGGMDKCGGMGDVLLELRVEDLRGS